MKTKYRQHGNSDIGGFRTLRAIRNAEKKEQEKIEEESIAWCLRSQKLLQAILLKRTN